MKKIVIIDGHPDKSLDRYCHVLADAYSNSAVEAGHEVRKIVVSELDFPILRTQGEWERGEVPDAIQESQDDIQWADHVVIIFPLWLGHMPAYLKAYLEQVFRPSFAFVDGKVKGKLQRKSARIITTMGMPSFVFNYFFFAHGTKALKRNILELVGMGPVRTTVLGMIEGADRIRERGLSTVKKIGRRGV